MRLVGSRISSYLSVVSLVLLSSCAFLTCGSERFALHIFSTKEIVGASVFVDQKLVGQMTRFSDGDYSHFAVWLPTSQHSVEILKEGYLPFLETVSPNMGDSEYYLHVVLKREK